LQKMQGQNQQETLGLEQERKDIVENAKY